MSESNINKILVWKIPHWCMTYLSNNRVWTLELILPLSKSPFKPTISFSYAEWYIPFEFNLEL